MEDNFKGTKDLCTEWGVLYTPEYVAFLEARIEKLTNSLHALKNNLKNTQNMLQSHTSQATIFNQESYKQRNDFVADYDLDDYYYSS
jgi:hypothetical protein